jgi:tungstate transport system substrate-binding protein
VLAQDKSIIVASTASTEDSDLFEYLLPLYKQKAGVTVKVIAQGTGQALDTGRRGDADVVFVHARSAELKFLSEGQGVKRYPVMYNDFVLIGPRRPSSRAATAPVRISPSCSFGRIPASISKRTRAHGIRRSARAWAPRSTPPTPAMHTCCPTVGTWINFKNKGDLQILVEGDTRMFNQYGVMLVNPEKHPNVKKELGQQFIDYLISPEGQKDIANYKINGEQLFYPNANDPGA